MSQQIDHEFPVATPATNAVTPSVGAVLRAAREAKGLPLAEVANVLKLGQRQVEALEQDDWSGLPGTTFVRGFVRNYARMLDIDAAPLMRSLDVMLSTPTDTLAAVSETTPAPMSSRATRSRDGLVVGVGGVILVVAALVYFLLPNDLTVLRSSLQHLLDGDSATEQTLATAPSATTDTAQPAPEGLFPPGVPANQLIAPQQPSAAGGIESPGTPAPESKPTTPQSASAATPAALAADAAEQAKNPPQLRLLASKDAWVEVRDRDGVIVFSQRLATGAEQVVAGKGPLSLVIGYAPGIRLFSYGKPVDLVPHTRGEVARLVLE